MKHVRIFQNKEVVHLFTHNSIQIFFIKLISEHAIVNLILIHNTKRRKVFFRFFLFLISQYLYWILHDTLFFKLGLMWFKTQEASNATITFPTRFSHIEN